MINVGMELIIKKKKISIDFDLFFLFRLSNPNIRQWMVDNNILSTKSLHKYYADRILDITRNISVTPIVWQDVWDEKVEVEIFISNYSFIFFFVLFSYHQVLLFKYGKIQVIIMNLVHGLLI
jgi:hypothetical protein